MDKAPRPFWPPLVAGTVLGLTLLLTFLITGHGLGASGFFTRFAAWTADALAPAWVSGHPYLGVYVQGDAVLNSWITWEVIGVFLGALAGSLTSGRFRLTVERGPRTDRRRRLLYALLGGILTGFGARLARGCTSGLGLSGGATLAVAAFLFLICFFAAGFAVSAASRRMWQ